ncbi:MAG: F0F1 ATP synthase subunit delta [Bacteroidales bacterium]|nr:F0F1 ATP synthase subunit delta [Bacteroidales bacterium]
MNTGIIAGRYAKALLLLTQETGRGEQVSQQIQGLLRDPDHLPAVLEPDLEKLLSLLARNGRVDYLKFVFQSFLRMYYDSVNIRPARLTTAVPAAELGKRLCDLVSAKSGCKVILESSVDPSIIGGFVFEIDDFLIDASVRAQIEDIRRQFVEKNTRLV